MRGGKGVERGTGWHKRLTKKIIEEGIVKKKMKMMMSEHKDPAAVLYPQLDSEQRKNEEEKSHRASLFKPFPCLFSKEETKRARRKEKKLLNSRTWLLDSDQHLLHKIHVCLFFVISGIPDEPRY